MKQPHFMFHLTLGAEEPEDDPIWLAMMDRSDHMRIANPPDAHLFGFRYSRKAGDEHWLCCAKDGVKLCAVDSGVVVVPKRRYKLEATLYEKEAVFRIDNIQVAAINTCLPNRELVGLYYPSGERHKGVFNLDYH